MQMPSFKAIPYEKGQGFWKTIFSYTRRLELTERYTLKIPGYDRIIVHKGFICDGASIPKCFRGLLSPVGILLIPGIIHDACYRYHSLYLEDEDTGQKMIVGINKEESDLLFLKIADYVTGLKWVNRIAYNAVKCFGHQAWDESREEG